MPNSLWPHGLQSTRLLCPWDFSRQGYWSGSPFPSPGDLPNPGIEPGSPALQADSLPTELQGKISYYWPANMHSNFYFFLNFVFIAFVKKFCCNEILNFKWSNFFWWLPFCELRIRWVLSQIMMKIILLFSTAIMSLNYKCSILTSNMIIK